MTRTTTYSDSQIMMTLAALAGTAGPWSEAVSAQQQAILKAITGQLTDASLATQNQWTIVWVGLTNDLANLCYIAQNTTLASMELAVVIRGTLGDDPIDTQEDLDVSYPTIDLKYNVDEKSITLGNVSRGASQASNEVLGAVYAPGDGSPLDGTTLLQALTKLVGTQASTIYVTGHSLGGAVASVLGLYLAEVASWNAAPAPIFQVHTFAAPTAGLNDFAQTFDGVFAGNDPSQNSAYRVYNVWDAVPTAWVVEQMNQIKTWYTTWGPPTSQPSLKDKLALEFLESKVYNLEHKLLYTQPTTNVTQLNNIEDGNKYPPQYDAANVQNFLAQVSFQHANNTYLNLLAAPTITPAPAAPTNPAAAPNNSGITVSWTASAQSASGGPVGGYNVLRSTTAGSGYELVGSVDATSTSYTDSTVTGPKTYYYVIQAAGTGGWSAISKEVSVFKP